jgi:hypothetical protein
VDADEVEHRAERLVLRFPEPSAELLQEEGRALGRPQHEHGVDVRDVDTFVEQVDREHGSHAPLREIAQGSFSLGPRAVAPDRDRLDSVATEVLGHESCVLDAHAEAETAHRRWLGMVGDLLDDEPGPGVGAGVCVAESFYVVALATTPGDLAEVEPVVDAEVEERCEVLLVDGIPETQFGSDAVVEPVQDRQAVASLGGGCESQELDGREVVEHAGVRRRCRVVELVDDDDVEVIWREVSQIAGVEALDRCEDVLESLRSCAAYPLLAERGLSQRVPERREALVEDLLPVGDEEKP